MQHPYDSSSSIPAGAEAFLDLLTSMQIELCVIGIAVLLFRHIHGGLVRANKSHKAMQTIAKVEPEVPKRNFSAEIKACGERGSLNRLRTLWKEASSQPGGPEACTLAPMAEALVLIDRTAEAWKLANEVWKDPKLYLTGDIVVYSSLLRGFSQAKQHGEVVRVFNEMRERRVQMNTITYNRVLHSVIREELWEQLPELLAQMKEAGPRSAPDIVTFSTLIKGYCQAGNLDAGLEILEHMRGERKIPPDEFTYNSLLEGCVKQRRLTDGLHLLNQMCEQGVAPSNYTLSIVIKLLGRFRRLQQAFAVAESVSKAYGFTPNIQVYTCLMQACFHSRRVSRAFHLHNKVVSEGLCPVDEKTYTVLARGCLQASMPQRAAQVVRCAYHLPEAGTLVSSLGKAMGVDTSCLKDVLQEFHQLDPEAAEQLKADLSALPSPPTGVRRQGVASAAPGHRSQCE